MLDQAVVSGTAEFSLCHGIQVRARGVSIMNFMTESKQPRSAMALEISSFTITLVLLIIIIISVIIIVALLKCRRKTWRNHSRSSGLDTRLSVVNNESEHVAVEKLRRRRTNARLSLCIKRLKDLDGSEYQKVEKHFREQWTKITGDYPVPPIPLAIYAIQNDDLTNKYHQYKSKTFGYSFQKPNEEWHFHGTSVECNIISSDKCCNDKTCGVCGISRNGFDLSFTKNTYQRFGKGIYLAPNSSKSNDYPTRKSLNQCGYKAQLLCLVACGNKHVLYNDDTSLVAPPENCHSVYGKASTSGKLNYDEVVVYDADAINPLFVIVYGNRVESSGIQEVYVAVPHQPKKKTNAVADEQNIWSYAQYSCPEHIRKLNADRSSLSVACGTTQRNRSQYMSDQLIVPYSGRSTSYGALMSEYRTDSGKHKRESQYHNPFDHFRSSISARGVSDYVTPSLKHKMGNVKQKSNSQYTHKAIHDQSKTSPSVTKYTSKPVSELEVGGSKKKNKSWNDQSRSSPSSVGKYGSRSATSHSEHKTKKRKNKDSLDQSWSSYIFESISNVCSSFRPEPKTIESKQRRQYDHSRSSPSATSLLENSVVDTKRKRESRYDHSRSSPSVGGISKCATPLSKHRMGGGKQKSKGYYDQFKSLSSAEGISSCATPSSGYKVNDGKQKQYNYSSSTGRVPRYSTSSLDHKTDDSQQKSKGHYGQSSIVKSFPRNATPQSERRVSAAKHQSKRQIDQSRKSPNSGVKSGCSITSQSMKSTTKGTRTRSGRAN